MRHAASNPSAGGGGSAEPEGGLLGALHHGMCGGSLGHHGMLPPHSVDLGDSCSSMHMPFGAGGSDVTSCFSQAIDRLDLAVPGNLRLGGLQFGSEAACMRAALGDGYPGGGSMDPPFNGASCAASSQYSSACPLSMLHYAGSSALGPGPSPMAHQSDPNGESQQARHATSPPRPRPAHRPRAARAASPPTMPAELCLIESH